MPALPACLLDPIRDRFAARLPERPAVAPTHPLGCRRPRVPDPVVFEHVVAALAHGSGDERIATPGCLDRAIRSRRREGAAGWPGELPAPALHQDDRRIGIGFADPAGDGGVTEAPGGGEQAGSSPATASRRGRP